MKAFVSIHNQTTAKKIKKRRKILSKKPQLSYFNGDISVCARSEKNDSLEKRTVD